MDLLHTTVHQNKQYRRFELPVDDRIAFVEYQAIDDETLVLTHTQVPAELEGQGVGSALVKGVLELVEREGLQVVPACPFVNAYIHRHPEWNRVVQTSYPLDDF